MHQPMIHLHPQVQYIWFALHTETGTNHAIQVSIVAPLVIWEVQVPISAAKVQIWWDSYYQHTVWNLSVALIRVLCQYSDNWYASRPTTDIIKGKNIMPWRGSHKLHIFPKQKSFHMGEGVWPHFGWQSFTFLQLTISCDQSQIWWLCNQYTHKNVTCVISVTSRDFCSKPTDPVLQWHMLLDS
jgi:hypothetical protein